jgi:two-component system C4-dicarboxylate transport response regulator DctD
MSAVGEEGEAGGGVVLVVDDSELMAELIAGTLEDAGFTIVVANSGAAALELARAHPFEVAVCDLNMPGMDGIELMRRLAAVDETLPVIMLTGDGDPDTVHRATEGGAFALVQKGGDLTPLVDLLPRALSLARAARAQRAA